MQQLALQVAEVDDVEVDDADAADARRGHIHGRRRSKSACADAEDASRLQLLLTIHADFRHDQVPRIALDLFRVQFRLRRSSRRNPSRH